MQQALYRHSPFAAMARGEAQFRHMRGRASRRGQLIGLPIFKLGRLSKGGKGALVGVDTEVVSEQVGKVDEPVIELDDRLLSEGVRALDNDLALCLLLGHLQKNNNAESMHCYYPGEQSFVKTRRNSGSGCLLERLDTMHTREQSCVKMCVLKMWARY